MVCKCILLNVGLYVSDFNSKLWRRPVYVTRNVTTYSMFLTGAIYIIKMDFDMNMKLCSPDLFRNGCSNLLGIINVGDIAPIKVIQSSRHFLLQT